MMPYAAYLRIYEPLSAFSDPERTQWAAYTASAARSRRMKALTEEYVDALRRVVAVPPVLVPERESEHAFVRWLEGVTYVCPWQTRLRSWLALSELRVSIDSEVFASVLGPEAGRVFGPAFGPSFGAQAEISAAAFLGRDPDGAAGRVYIKTNTWSVPLTWFVPFAHTERRMIAGGSGGSPAAAGSDTAGDPGAALTARVPQGVTITYSTAMSQARQRVARALSVLRGTIRLLPDHRGPLLRDALATEAELAELGRWLAEFHPYSLAELDYGGLVRLLSDQTLRADESVAEIAAAIEALARSEWEVAVAMHQRAATRWRIPRVIACAN